MAVVLNNLGRPADATRQRPRTPQPVRRLPLHTAHASVGGKIAQIGSRLGDRAAQKMAADFFEALNDQSAVRGLMVG